MYFFVGECHPCCWESKCGSPLCLSSIPFPLCSLPTSFDSHLTAIVRSHGLAVDHQRKVVKRTRGDGVIGSGGQTFIICGDFGLVLGVYFVPDTSLSQAKNAMSEIINRHESIKIAVPPMLYVDCGCCGNTSRTSFKASWRSTFTFKLDVTHLMLVKGSICQAKGVFLMVDKVLVCKIPLGCSIPRISK